MDHVNWAISGVKGQAIRAKGQAIRAEFCIEAAQNEVM
jgi:hypothetical protein